MKSKTNVSGHLRDVNGIYHTVISYRDKNGNNHSTSKTTKLPSKGNKRKAEAILRERLVNFTVVEVDADTGVVAEGANVPIEDYTLDWIEMRNKLGQIRPNTYASYLFSQKSIDQHFSGRNITVGTITPDDIDDFYLNMLEKGQSGSTVHKHHSVLHGALKYAVKKKLIPFNPDDQTDKPKVDKYQASFLTKSEIDGVIVLFIETPLEWIVKLGLFYGLRRSEILGLKWSSFDFDKDTMTIQSTVTYFTADGKKEILLEDKTKSGYSLRTMPLFPELKEFLQKKKAERDYYRSICGNSYNKDYLDYVFTNEMGDIYNPNYVTAMFQKRMKMSGLEKHIRFHDLRHSYAVASIRAGDDIKTLQGNLGHHTAAFTLDIYGHVTEQMKQASSDRMQGYIKDVLNL